MTYFHYYATTSRNLDRVVQYGIFPLAHAVGLCTFPHNPKWAADVARVISTLSYAALTSTFFGLESELIDDNSRKAVAAEMGIAPSKVEFSDYKYSNNAIVHKAYSDLIRLQKYRFGTDAMFVLPNIMHQIAKDSGVKWPKMRDARDNPENYTIAEKLFNAHNAWDYGVYAGKAAYWGAETFLMSKTGHYEVHKFRETIQSTGKDVKGDDLLAIYQRTRNDRKLSMIENDSAVEQKVIRSLMERMAAEYNKHDGKFGVPEIMYLIGMGKINIHSADNMTVNDEAVARSFKEIDKVVSIGLKGIQEENRRNKAMLAGGMPFAEKHAKTFTDRFVNGAFSASQKVLGKFRPEGYKTHPEESISVRNPEDSSRLNLGLTR